MAIESIDICSKRNSINAEERTIENILLYGVDSLNSVLKWISPDDIYNGRLRTIFEYCIKLKNKGIPIEPNSLAEELGKKLEIIGGRGFIAQLVNDAARPEHLLSYVETIKRESLTRQEIARLRKRLHDLETRQVEIELPSSNHIKIMTDKEIVNLNLPEVVWIVPGLIPEGLTILAGKPKLGKSWLVLTIGLGIANGGYVLGKIPVKKFGVLYLALEDTARRMQDRLKQLNIKPSENLYISFEWRKGEAGASDIDQWLTEHPETKLIVIDTLQKMREPVNSRRSVYEVDYETIGILKKVADKHGAAIIVVHHTRKGASDDPLETISGSTGLTGAADTLLVLNRGRGQVDAVLFATGRDIDENEIALQKDPCAGWVLLGDASEYRHSQERRQILDLLSNNPEGLTPKDIAEEIGKTSNNTRVILHRMENDGLITKLSYGKYIKK